jgi:Flp pilus assembly protein TadG
MVTGALSTNPGLGDLMTRSRNQAGAVTAETAVALPVLIVLTAALAWLVALGVTQARVVDAARETARALARGDEVSVSEQYGRRIAPDGARIRITRGDGEVQVEVSSQVSGPGGVFKLPGFLARSTAVARAEP